MDRLLVYFGAFDPLADPMVRDALRAGLAIMDSMTPAERSNPALICESRIQRIAVGSGTDARAVRTVLTGMTEPK